jgi:DNA-binding transcriptional ArsR family regulator
VLLALAEAGESSVGGLCARLRLPQTRVSHALQPLRLAGVVGFRRAGKQVFYGLSDSGRALVDAVRPLVGA